MRVLQPVATGMLRRGLNVTADGVARSVEKIDAAFAKIDALLADGRRYLVGGRFTVADLTFASLASPVLGPPEHPVGIAFDLGPEGTAGARRGRRRARASSRCGSTRKSAGRNVHAARSVSTATSAAVPSPTRRVTPRTRRRA